MNAFLSLMIRPVCFGVLTLAVACGTDASLTLDSDGDGLTDAQELALGTDPHDDDTDHDGLDDGAEVNVHHTDPHASDSDDDGLSDHEEVTAHHTDPIDEDSDSDGLQDGEEVNEHNTDPHLADTDGDGESDGHEVVEGADPHVDEGNHDHADYCDGHTCLCEFHPDASGCVTFCEAHQCSCTDYPEDPNCVQPTHSCPHDDMHCDG